MTQIPDNPDKQRKTEMIGRLTSGVAHDFNNLLHVVNMNLEVILICSQDAKVKAAVDRAKLAARRGARLTGQLLAFGRSQSNAPRPIDANKLLLGMKDLLEIAASSSVVVELELDEQPAVALIDASQLEMCVLDHALDSRDAMPEGGALKISTSHAGGYVVVTASDSSTRVPLELKFPVAVVDAPPQQDAAAPALTPAQ